jgi:hypothetical protein
MRNFLLFVSGHYASAQVALEKIKTAFQTERQNCLCITICKVFKNDLRPFVNNFVDKFPLPLLRPQV